MRKITPQSSHFLSKATRRMVCRLTLCCFVWSEFSYTAFAYPEDSSDEQPAIPQPADTTPGFILGNAANNQTAMIVQVRTGADWRRVMDVVSTAQKDGKKDLELNVVELDDSSDSISSVALNASTRKNDASDIQRLKADSTTATDHDQQHALDSLQAQQQPVVISSFAQAVHAELDKIVDHDFDARAFRVGVRSVIEKYKEDAPRTPNENITDKHQEKDDHPRGMSYADVEAKDGTFKNKAFAVVVGLTSTGVSLFAITCELKMAHPGVPLTLSTIAAASVCASWLGYFTYKIQRHITLYYRAIKMDKWFQFFGAVPEKLNLFMFHSKRFIVSGVAMGISETLKQFTGIKPVISIYENPGAFTWLAATLSVVITLDLAAWSGVSMAVGTDSKSYPFPSKKWDLTDSGAVLLFGLASTLTLELASLNAYSPQHLLAYAGFLGAGALFYVGKKVLPLHNLIDAPKEAWPYVTDSARYALDRITSACSRLFFGAPKAKKRLALPEALEPIPAGSGS